MSKFDAAMIQRIEEDKAKNPEYKMFMEQDNYISEEAIKYVLFMMDYYIQNGGLASVENIQSLFGFNESKAKQTVETLKNMGLIQ